MVPATAIPDIAPVEDLTRSTDGDGNEVLQWTHPDPGSLDGIYVYVESYDDQEGIGYGLGPAETTLTIPSADIGPGLSGVEVVPHKWGNGGRYSIVGVVR